MWVGHDNIFSYFQSKTSERLKSYTRHLVAPSVRCMTEGGIGAKLHRNYADYRHLHIERQKARAQPPCVASSPAARQRRLSSGNQLALSLALHLDQRVPRKTRPFIAIQKKSVPVEALLGGVREAEANKEHDHATSSCNCIGDGLCRRFHTWICARSGFWHGARNWWGCI